MCDFCEDCGHYCQEEALMVGLIAVETDGDREISRRNLKSLSWDENGLHLVRL